MAPKRKLQGRGLSRLIWTLFGACVLVFAGLALYAEFKISRLVLGGLGESFTSRIFSAPFPLDPRTQISPRRLITRLERLRYRRTSDPRSPGEYSWNPPFLALWLRGFKSPLAGQEAALVHLKAIADNHWELDSAAGSISLEPELLAELSGPRKIRREPAKSEEIPLLLKQAVITAEDKRFYSHFGIDPRAIARAAWGDLTRKGEFSGASTITQQLAKNFFLTPKRTIGRKIIEAALALYLELRRGKEDILTLYLNHIYWGQEGPTSVAGIKAAASFYYGKNPAALSLPESALLAGMIRSPYRYNPRRNPEAAKGRRDFILRRMQEGGLIGVREMREALSAPVKATPLAKKEAGDAGAYFAAEAERDLLSRYGEDTLYRYGLSIHTTMDPLLEDFAARSLRALRSQGALVALDPRSGQVLALAGGKEFRESQFNRATQARRQPGSAFKPFVFGAALEAGFTPATILRDQPRKFGKDWEPKNFDGVYFGTVTLRTALAHSLNLATLDLAQRVGPDRIAAFAGRMGITSPLDKSLALALGDSEVTLLEIVAAYAPFAGGGMRAAPRLISSVSDAEGNVLEYSRFERAPALDPALSFLITSLLESAVAEGTGRSLAAMGWTRPTAGKTGTTNDGRDAWFVGYTPRFLTGVWIGDDANRGLRLTGAKDAIPVWAAFMKEAEADAPGTSFEEPKGLVRVRIDPASGLLARSGCPGAREEAFVSGTQPTQFCPLHPGGLAGWIRRLFRRN